MAEGDRFSSRKDQASRLRQLVAAAPARPEPEVRPHIISVVSGKGGVGKTLVATNLAIALSARGHRVVLFDMDMGLANADIVLGVDSTVSWSDVLDGRRSIDEVVIDAPGGVAFVPGASGIAHLADLSEFERHQLLAAMQRIESDHDVVVLDCGAGISRNVLAFTAAADTALVITNPEPTSITDAYAMVKALAAMVQDRPPADGPGSIGMIVNNAASRSEAKEVYERIAGVAARFLHLPVSDYGYILRDDHVPAAIRQRSPLVLRYPRCSAAGCLMSIALRVSREIGTAEAEQGFLARVVRLFV